MLSEVLVILYGILFSVCILFLLITSYELFKIDKNGLINFILGLIFFAIASVTFLVEHFIFAPLSNIELVLFYSFIILFALMPIFFIARGISLIDMEERAKKTNKFINYSLFLSLIYACIIAAFFEVFTAVFFEDTIIQDIFGVIGDVVWVVGYIYFFIYLFELRRPYKGLLYKLVSYYIIFTFIFTICAGVMLITVSPIDTKDVDNLFGLSLFRILILNMAAITILFGIILVYRTIAMFHKLIDRFTK